MNEQSAGSLGSGGGPRGDEACWRGGGGACVVTSMVVTSELVTNVRACMRRWDLGIAASHDRARHQKRT